MDKQKAEFNPREKMEEINAKRVEARKNKLFSYLLFLPGILFIVLFLFVPVQGDAKRILNIVFIIGALISFVVASVFIYRANKIVNKVKHIVETDFVVPTVESFFTNCKLETSVGLRIDEINNSGIVPSHDVFFSSHRISGEESGVNFKGSYVRMQKIERYVDNKGNVHQRYVTVFNGTYLVMEFPKNVKGHVIVSEKRGFGGKLNKIELESIEFNKKFRTYSKSDVEAFYVITPHFIEAMLELEKKHPGALSFAFLDNRLYFSVYDNKKRFSYNLGKPVDDNLFQDLKIDADIIKNIIKGLKLNRNIFG